MAKGWKAWTQEELETLEKNAGVVSLDAIAAALGRSKKSVQYYALRHGISLRIKTVDDHDAYLCRELHKEGLSIAVIAEKMELTRNKVFNIVYRGIK